MSTFRLIQYERYQGGLVLQVGRLFVTLYPWWQLHFSPDYPACSASTISYTIVRIWHSLSRILFISLLVSLKLYLIQRRHESNLRTRFGLVLKITKSLKSPESFWKKLLIMPLDLTKTQCGKLNSIILVVLGSEQLYTLPESGTFWLLVISVETNFYSDLQKFVSCPFHH